VISAALHDEVRGVLRYQVADLGFLTLKNIRRVRTFQIGPASYIRRRDHAATRQHAPREGHFKR
jgi:hypothetical protein